jgi:two-component system, OmpR family, phosphate regulon sensor histidine kinase PhoR
MKPRFFNLIISIAFVSLLGVVFTQVFWVQNAIYHKQDQFRQSVSIAMKTVFNQLLELDNVATLQKKITANTSSYNKGELSEELDEALIDSLIKAELACMRIFQDYVYGFYNRDDSSFVLGTYDGYTRQLMSSEHQQNIRTLIDTGDSFFSIFFPQQQGIIYNQILVWMALSAIFLLIMIFSFWVTIKTVLQQKKLSEMKTDFINNMTHEFKTPIATISLASEMLMKPEVNQTAERTAKYAAVIFNENQRLQSQVDQVLQMAILDKGETQLTINETAIHKLLENVVDGFEIRVRELGGEIRAYYAANPNTVLGDPMHLTNVFSNLVENAVKYSNGPPIITITTSSDKNGVTVSVADKGIGISIENQELIFKNLYRVHTGNLHDVKGFGLGLFYVKRLVEMHGGSIKLHSELGKGSVFSVFLPYKTT